MTNNQKTIKPHCAMTGCKEETVTVFGIFAGYSVFTCQVHRTIFEKNKKDIDSLFKNLDA